MDRKHDNFRNLNLRINHGNIPQLWDLKTGSLKSHLTLKMNLIQCM